MIAEAFLMRETLTARQRQTEPGRRALAEHFPTPELKTQHYQALGRRSAERRLTLSADEATAVVEAYSLLARIAERARLKLETAPNQESAA
jgi:hypothetical protein